MNERISAEAMQEVRYGHIPEAMEDHWFMYCDESTIRYHRSWKGYLAVPMTSRMLPCLWHC